MTQDTQGAADAQSTERSKQQRPFLKWSRTFMRRKTHMNQNAEVGLGPACAQWFAPVTSTNLRELFEKPERPLVLEIGFGMGTSLIQMAQNEPEVNFVGVEVHQPGLGGCAYTAKSLGITNLKLIEGDALELLARLPDEHIDRIQLYFPDPWQKKRHHKRRFVSSERMALVHKALKTGGEFHTATDWEHYSQWMLEVLDSMPEFSNKAGAGNFHERPEFRPLTKFEQRGLNLGHGVWDLIYTKR